MRLIDAEKIPYNRDICLDWVRRETIDKLPTIEPESLRPRGEWAYIEDDWNDTVAAKCSQCGVEFFGEDIRSFDQFHYCPNCGAKMDAEVNP